MAVIFVVFVVVTVILNNSEATSLALATARSNSALVERLGQPIQSGWFIQGSIETSPGFGKAELVIPIAGPNGKGTLYALAEKTAGLWKLTFLQFGADNESSRLQLLEP